MFSRVLIQSRKLNLNNRTILSITFILYGIFSVLNLARVIPFTEERLTGAVFIFYGAVTVFLSFSNQKRENLVFASGLFLVGVILLVKSNFEIIDTRGIVFTSTLFISGALLLILFIDNTKEKVFLYSGIVLILMSYLSITVLKNIGLFEIANKAGDYFKYFWPVLLIVFGISIFINRSK